MSDPKGFLKHPREEIPVRDVRTRVQDWREVDVAPDEKMLRTQSSRCMDCGVAFCQGDTGCPVHNLIPEWNTLVSTDRWQEASVRLHATNNFPEFTSRLCPAPCESACVLGVNADPVSIKMMEWGIVDRAFQSGWVKPEIAPVKSGKQIAVVGSGPAGLAAAQQLARAGHAVTVFEKSHHIGGLLRYGIPDFKMEKDLIERRARQMEAEGVVFRPGVQFGTKSSESTVSYADIQEHFDALVLTTGAERPRDLQVPGRELRGVHFAMDYLTEQNRLSNGEISTLTINAYGKRVLILGGGDTGSDCLGTALRQGAASVLQFEINPKPPVNRAATTPWPYWPMKLKTSHSHEEGGLREWSLTTESFFGEGGHVRGVRTKRLGIEDSPEHTFPADLVILAMGFTGARQELAESLPGLTFTERGVLSTDAQFMTPVDGVFAGGDVRRGASLIVWAIAEGRRIATAVDTYLKTRSLRRNSFVTRPHEQSI